MVTPDYRVVWTKRSQHDMKMAFDYISKDSVPNAVKVIEEIADAVLTAERNPEFYNPDKYKLKNDGTYRAFEKHHYRISYRFGNGVVRILQIRHTSREPELY